MLKLEIKPDWRHGFVFAGKLQGSADALGRRECQALCTDRDSGDACAWEHTFHGRGGLRPISIGIWWKQHQIASVQLVSSTSTLKEYTSKEALASSSDYFDLQLFPHTSSVQAIASLSRTNQPWRTAIPWSKCPWQIIIHRYTYNSICHYYKVFIIFRKFSCLFIKNMTNIDLQCTSIDIIFATRIHPYY